MPSTSEVGDTDHCFCRFGYFRFTSAPLSADRFWKSLKHWAITQFVTNCKFCESEISLSSLHFYTVRVRDLKVRRRFLRFKVSQRWSFKLTKQFLSWLTHTFACRKMDKSQKDPQRQDKCNPNNSLGGGKGSRPAAYKGDGTQADRDNHSRQIQENKAREARAKGQRWGGRWGSSSGARTGLSWIP